MSAQLTQLADALVTDLNVASRFSQAITAERVPVVSVDVKDISGLMVRVVTHKENSRREDRSRRQYEYTIDVGVMKKLSAVTNALIDPLVLLAEEIADWWFTHLPVGRSEVLISADTIAPYSSDILQTKSTFMTVLRLTFRGWRS